MQKFSDLYVDKTGFLRPGNIYNQSEIIITLLVLFSFGLYPVTGCYNFLLQ